jgi:hypothetical protein
MIILTMRRYGKNITFKHASVKQAAHDACADIETNEACPVKIEQDGVIIWENLGPNTDSYSKLIELSGLPQDYFS